jgi:endonuclease/exonuclease/phosphatase family protein
MLGSFNCHMGRPEDLVYDAVAGILHQHHPRALAIQEGWPYLHVFNDLPGYHPLGFNPSGTGILVRDDVRHTRLQLVPLGDQPWTFRGNVHVPRQMPVVLLNNRQWFASIHGVPYALGDERLAEYQEGSRRIVAWSNAHAGRPQILIGDWNKLPSEEGKFTPDWVAGQIGGNTWRTREVVFPITRGCNVTQLEVLDEGGSDHPLILITVRKAPS